MHTLFGYLIHSRNEKEINLNALVALLHHPYGAKVYENYTGKKIGEATEIPPEIFFFLKISRLFDAYSAIAEQRAYHLKRQPIEVLLILLEDYVKGEFDSEIFTAFYYRFLEQNPCLFELGKIYNLPMGKIAELQEQYQFQSEDIKDRDTDFCIMVT